MRTTIELAFSESSAACAESTGTLIECRLSGAIRERSVAPAAAMAFSCRCSLDEAVNLTR
jgi:hypothetical protein